MAKYPHRLLLSHQHTEPDQITLFAPRWKSESCYAVADRCVGWASYPFPVQ
jgi:hypothetical protein